MREHLLRRSLGKILRQAGQQHDDRPVQHLVFHGWLPDGPRFRCTLREVDSLHRRSPVGAVFGTFQQALQVRLQIFAVGGDRLAIHSRCAVPADFPIGLPQPQRVHVMTQRGERAAHVFLRHFCDVLLAG
jgi:hypothetical protein